MTTTTTEAVVEIDLDRLVPHPRNVRRSLGDRQLPDPLDP